MLCRQYGPTQWEQVDDAAIEASGKRLAALYSTKIGEDGAAGFVPRRPARVHAALASRNTRRAAPRAVSAPVFEDDEAEILEDPLARPQSARSSATVGTRSLVALCVVSPQGLGWLNEHSLSLSKQRPAGRVRKKRGVFAGASCQHARARRRLAD